MGGPSGSPPPPGATGRPQASAHCLPGRGGPGLPLPPGEVTRATASSRATKASCRLGPSSEAGAGLLPLRTMGVGRREAAALWALALALACAQHPGKAHSAVPLAGCSAPAPRSPGWLRSGSRQAECVRKRLPGMGLPCPAPAARRFPLLGWGRGCRGCRGLRGSCIPPPCSGQPPAHTSQPPLLLTACGPRPRPSPRLQGPGAGPGASPAALACLRGPRSAPGLSGCPWGPHNRPSALPWPPGPGPLLSGPQHPFRETPPPLRPRSPACSKGSRRALAAP